MYANTTPIFKIGLRAIKRSFTQFLLEISEGKLQFRLVYIAMLNGSKSHLDLSLVFTNVAHIMLIYINTSLGYR